MIRYSKKKMTKKSIVINLVIIVMAIVMLIVVILTITAMEDSIATGWWTIKTIGRLIENSIPKVYKHSIAKYLSLNHLNSNNRKEFLYQRDILTIH